MIETRNLTVAIDGAKILHDITLALPKGKLTAIVGPNGAGKSTLLTTMGRLTPIRGGEVLFDGFPIGDIATAALAKRLSIFRQSTPVTPRLSVRDLISFGRYPHSRGTMSGADKVIVEQAIARLDLWEFADRYLDALSGGQRQRALLAMVLAQTGDVMLLDEPLNNLDISHARTVMRVAREEVNMGRTVAVVIHDLTVAGAHCDHVIALKNGRLHSAGTPEEVLNEEGLSDLYDTRVDVVEIDGRRIVMTV
ncbi:ABC transporter ATP-binding protein [Celeribacter sp.]|uniref:iron ABC transporter ATP-binding protein n=1 Tax=Celeribacter sp. TaxID=1890673 RepID=UPI003A8EF380